MILRSAWLLEAAPMIASVVHELQRERGLTVGYIDSREESLATAMRNQRPQTDKALAVWDQRVAEYEKSYPGTKFANNLDIAKKRLAELPKMRSAIDGSTTDSQKVMEVMVSAVAGLLNVVDAIDDMTENGQIIHQADAMVTLMRRKEYSGARPRLGNDRLRIRPIHPADLSGVHAQPRISQTPSPPSSDGPRRRPRSTS